jgi:hypothetical protein
MFVEVRKRQCLIRADTFLKRPTNKIDATLKRSVLICYILINYNRIGTHLCRNGLPLLIFDAFTTDVET